MAFCYELGFGLPTKTVDASLFQQLLNDEKQRVRVALIRYFQTHSLAQPEGLTGEAAALHAQWLGEWQQKAQEAKKGVETKDYVDFLKKQLYLVIFIGTFEPTYTDKQLEQLRKKLVTLEEFKRKFTPLPRRKQAAICLNGLVAADIDHMFGSCNPMGIRAWWEKTYAEQLLPLMEKGEIPRIHLAYISARGDGIKVIFEARKEWGNLISNQIKLAEYLGFPVDEQCKDGSRGQFLTTQDDVLYSSGELFGYHSQDYSDRYSQTYRGGSSQSDLFKTIGVETTAAPAAEAAEGEAQAEEGVEYYFEGLKVSDIIRVIIGEDNPEENKRHHYALKLAVYLRYMVGRNEAKVRKALLTQPWFRSLEKEDKVESDRCISDGMRYEMNLTLPKEVAAAVKKLKGDSGEGAGAAQEGDAAQNDALPFEEWGRRIGEMARYYPALKECLEGLEPRQYPAGLFVAAAFFGTLMTRCYYHFYHNPTVMRRLNYCVYIIGDPGCGKSFATRLYNLIASPILAADEVSTMQINNYKKAVKEQETKRDSKKGEGLQKPQVIVRCHGVRTSNSVFIEDMFYAVDDSLPEPMHLHMLTFDAELDSLAFANRGGQFIDKSTFELKAFHNETDNQNYKNMDSITGPFDVFWNYVYTGTPLALNRKIKPNNIGSGLSTRLAVIPMASTKYKMMPLRKGGETESQSEQLIKDWACKLDKVAGDLDCWDLVEHVYRWCSAKMEQADINSDDVVEMLCKRVPYYGINVPMPFLMMRHWDEWSKERTMTFDKIDYELSTLVMDIQYACQIHFFGKYTQAYFDEQKRDVLSKVYVERDKTTAYYAALKEQFTLADLQQVSDLTYQGACSVLRKWEGQKRVRKSGRGKKAIYTKI